MAILIDYTTPYKGGPAFYAGVLVQPRTATGSGTGTQNAIGVHIAPRTATGSGTGNQTASGVHISPRTATGSGVGSATADWNVNPARTATGSGTGTSTTLSVRVVLRTSTGTGAGTSTAVRLVISLRTGTGEGTGTSTTIGARTLKRSSTSTGEGASTAVWVKSHIFRVPTTEGYPFAERLSEEPKDRLFAHTPQGARAKNLYRLTNGTYTTTDPRRPELISRAYYGGHNIFLTDDEVTELTAAGYGASIT